VFDSVRIQTKLAMAVAIPMVAVAGISSFAVVLAHRSADEAEARSAAVEAQIQVATATAAPRPVVLALQTERAAEAAVLAGADPTAAGLPPATPGQHWRAETDEALARFRADLAGRPAEARAAFAPYLGALKDIERIRAEADAYTGVKQPANQLAARTYDDYTKAIMAVDDGAAAAARPVGESPLRTGADLLNLAARNRENAIAATRTATGDGSVLADRHRVELLAAVARWDLIDAQMRRAAGESPYTGALAQGVAQPAWTAFRGALDAAARGDGVDLDRLSGAPAGAALAADARWETALADQLTAAGQELQTESDNELADARGLEQRLIAFGMLVVALAGAVAFVASRSISRPLHRLAGEAEAVAQERLPAAVGTILDTPDDEEIRAPEMQPVPAEGGAEIAEVASSLNSVQASAAQLALEQAALRRRIGESFVSLGRRNQELLTRQIDSITAMERSEADPDMLQELFSLDHLATRMRRNAESLLLLGGLEPQRQWSAPVPLIDAVRSALGEIEDYSRVNIRRLDPAFVSGAAVADLSHILAELLENALNFSPPDQRVDVAGRRNGDSYALAIVDSGLGMSDEELEQANRRIAGLESYTVAPSRYLGHHVVGVHAKRLGMPVKLQPSPARGVTARLELGPVLVDEHDAPAAGNAGLPGDAAMAGGGRTGD
jgi:signal transduction histidine kinase